MRVYATATDHFNMHPYMLLVPAHYQPHLPDEFLDGTFHAPFFDEPDPKAMVRAMLPISYMVNMFTTKITFSFVEDRDVAEVLFAIDNYLMETKDLRLQDKSVAAYVNDVLALRRVIYKEFAKVMGRHPEWRKAYDTRPEVMKLLDRLYTGSTNSSHPIAALERPPVEELPIMRSLSEKLNDLQRPSLGNQALMPSGVSYDV